MKFASDLSLMRKEWYNAFYSVNTEQLDYLETEHFFSTNGMRFIYKKNQLSKLGALKKQNPSAFKGYKRSEKSVELRELGNIAVASGIATVSTPSGSREVKFIESWIKINDCWKLQFMSFEGDAEE